MTDEYARQFEQLVRNIAPHSRLVQTWHLSGGMSAEMTAFEIDDDNGHRRRMIIRLPGEACLADNPQAAVTEFNILKLTKALGLATPAPYYLDQTNTLFSQPYLVIEYIEGAPVFAPVDVADFVCQLATQLAYIHAADLAKHDLSFLPQRSEECKELTKLWPSEMTPSLEVDWIRAKLEQLDPPQRKNRPVLLHGDYWPANTLWRNNVLVAVIDWESAALGEPLEDLAISRLEMAILYGIEAMYSFTHRYLSLLKIDYGGLPYWDLYAALRLARLVGNRLADWCTFHNSVGKGEVTEAVFGDRFRRFTIEADSMLNMR